MNENLIDVTSVALTVANRRKCAIAVFEMNYSYGKTYNFVDASEWEQGNAYGIYIMTVKFEK